MQTFNPFTSTREPGFLAGVYAALQWALSPSKAQISAESSPGHFSNKRADFPKRANTFSKMPFRLCVSGCSRYLSSSDGHNLCLSCLDCTHAETVFGDGSCSHFENMTMAMLRSRLSFLVREKVTSVAPCPGPSAMHKATGQSDAQ